MRRWPAMIGAACACCFAAHAAVVRTGAVSCAPTAEAAVARYFGDAATPGTAGLDAAGLRVSGERVDPMTGARWLVLRRCDVPGALPVLWHEAGAGRSRATNAAVIHAGETVVVKSQNDAARVRLLALALDSGAAGDEVRVQFVGWSDGVKPGVVTAFVIGKGEVAWRR